MNIWVVTYNLPELYNGEYYTGEIVLEKAFLTKKAAQAWIDEQEYWWKCEPYALPV